MRIRVLMMMSACACTTGGDPFDAGADDAGEVDARTDARTPDATTPDAQSDTGELDVGMDTGRVDTDVPFPIDRGGEPGTPETYKGLPLSLVDNGQPTIDPVDGVVGVVCVGMSNATQECSSYIEQATTVLADEIHDRVVIVDCAVGGNAIEHWNNPELEMRNWRACIDRKIPAAGIRPDQVRVIYHKAANKFGEEPLYYPDPGSNYFAFRDNLDAFAARAPLFLPSVQAIYTTSRMYGGFTDRVDRGEPRSYEEGHALNDWLQENPDVAGVWHGWGPYIWAPSCESGEVNGSGVCYEFSDMNADGVHPGTGARAKISTLIHARFSQHAWYRP